MILASMVNETTTFLFLMIQFIYFILLLFMIVSNVILTQYRKNEADNIINMVFAFVMLKVVMGFFSLLLEGRMELAWLHRAVIFINYVAVIPCIVLSLQYLREVAKEKVDSSKRLVTISMREKNSSIVIKEPKICLVLFGIVCTILLILNIASLHHPMIYDIEDGYHVAGLMNIQYDLLILLSLVLMSVVVIRMKVFSKRQMIYFHSYLIFPIFGMILQIAFDTQFDFDTFGLVLAVSFVYIIGHMDRGTLLVVREGELGEAKIGIMMSQMQPHFLYNALNSIYHLCDTSKEDTQQAISDFSEYLRENLDSIKRTTPIEFEKELDHLKIYISLEKMRFQDNLTVEFDIETKDFEIPSLSIQPIVENAIKHGIGKSWIGGKIMVSTKDLGKRVRIVVSDNGVGFDPTVKKNDGRSHIGVENVRGRIESMVGGTMEIKSKIGIGTDVVIEIPKRRKV